MPKGKKRKRSEKQVEKLRRRQRGFAGQGTWQPGDPIPTRKISRERLEEIGRKRHEAALKKYKRRKKRRSK